jgi:hypothetical protein
MRILDFTRPTKNHNVNKYLRYIQSYQFYEATPQRKEYRKDYGKQYREQNADEIECDCGSIVKTLSLYAHIKSQKHFSFVENGLSPKKASISRQTK